MKKIKALGQQASGRHVRRASVALSVCRAVIISGAFSGCVLGRMLTAGPDYEEPKLDLPSSFPHAQVANGGSGQPVDIKSSVDTKWWALFSDPLLNSLVLRSVESNLDTKVALSRIQEAKAMRATSILDFFPVVRSEASSQSYQQSSARLPFAPANLLQIDLYNAELNASWELDLFGRLRRIYESNDAAVDAAEAGHRDVIVSVIGQVATSYIEMRGLQEQLIIARKNAGNQSETLRLTQVLQVGGRGTELDTSRAEAQLQQTLSMIPNLEARLQYAKNRIAVLLGKNPGELDSELGDVKPIPNMTKQIAIGNPAELIRRRPDVRMMERSLAASTAKVGVAVSDLFPRVSFSGNLGYEARTVSDFGIDATVYGFGPRLSWAAFDIGRVFNQISAAEANVEGQLAQYKQMVLRALEEADNALILYGREMQAMGHLERAAEASDKATKIARERFETGVSDFLTVLDSERRQLEVDTSLAQAQTRVTLALVGIYRALGGGWEAVGNDANQGEGKDGGNEGSGNSDTLKTDTANTDNPEPKGQYVEQDAEQAATELSPKNDLAS